MIYYQQGNATIHNGDCLEVLRTLPDESVHCCVTSPPYWGLRDYGTGLWKGGTDPQCDHSGKPHELTHDGKFFRSMCQKCGAICVDYQIGLDATPEAYVSRLVEVFREVRRVLRSDGTLWLNLGDSYASGKQLVGIPWRVAFALQADGWWLRQDIIWHKPNPMPESVRDRCTKAHEYVFLLAKSDRYYYDAEAVAEPSAYPGDNRALRTDTRKEVDRMCQDGGSRARTGNPTSDTRNRRSVWTVSTKPYAGAHFATMPPDLVEPCIMAGTSAEGCCAACGAPWQRVVERETIRRNRPNAFCSYRDVNGQPDQTKAGVSTTTLGWERTCECDEARVSPCTVLDPFNGAATVGLVSLQLQRRYIGIELNPEYCKISVDRINMEARQKRLFAARGDS